jgi:hypothetical protein
MKKIGQFCTCDVENYGDILYPICLNKILLANNSTVEPKAFSFIEGAALGDAGYNVSQIQKVLNNQEAISSLIIGGGDIIRSDKFMLASHYVSLYRHIRHETILQKIMEKIFGIPDLVLEFIEKYMNYEASGPFIIDKNHFNHLNEVIYCSCGVPFEFPDQVKSSVTNAFNNASFIYLRDEQSKQKLINVGVTNKIHVAPDLICTISDFFDFNTHKKNGLEILYAHGLQDGKDFLCFQANPTCRSSIDEIITQLTKIKAERNLEIVLLPIGYCHDDDVILKEINDQSNNQFIYANVHSIYDMLSIITASSVFIGTSMHGNITAFSYGIPHLVAPINVDKMRGFLDVCNLSNNLLLDSWKEMAEKLDFLDTLERDYFSSRAIIAKDKIYKVTDNIFKLISDEH